MNDIRSFTDMAVKWGRNRQSAQTKFLHYFNHGNNEPHDAIPLVENALFALSLFQTKTSEGILEGKGIIEALLHFQNRSLELSNGNFPVYLHNYPNCHDKFTGMRLFPAFYWIYRCFHQILGNDLKTALETSCSLIIQHALKLYRESDLPYEIKLRLATSLQAWGHLVKEEQWITEGKVLENQLVNILMTEFPLTLYSPTSLAEMLVSIQLAHTSIYNSLWQPFWKHLENRWNRDTCCYCGPSLSEFQWEYEPETTLYDLFCGYFAEATSKRTQKSHHAHLQAALIRPVEERFSNILFPMEQIGCFSSSDKWYFKQEKNYALSVIEELNQRPINEKGVHLFKLLWATSEEVHSFVCQNKAGQKFTFQEYSEGIDLFFELCSPPQADERDKGKEISFFLDLTSNPHYTISKTQTNTFQCGEVVLVEAEGLSFEVVFTVEKGEGQFFGHVMYGNRPSQLAAKGSNRFNAYDSEFFIRTVRRSTPCTVKVAIKIL